MQKLARWFRDNSLWLVGFGLMLASSGLDGVYMSKWMPPGWGWLGLVLNTTSDISSMVIIYWYGRLRQDRSSTKRRLSIALLGAEVVAITYPIFFGWRQLRAVLPQYESQDWQWVAIVSAGFIPLLLAFVGYAQALLAGRVEDPKPTEAQTAAAHIASEAAASTPRPRATIDDWRALLPDLNGETAELSAGDVAEIVHQAGFDPPSTRTCSAWARSARQKGE